MLTTRDKIIIGIAITLVVSLVIGIIVSYKYRENFEGPYTFMEGPNSERLFYGDRSPQESLSTIDQHYYSLGGGDAHFPYTKPLYLKYEDPYAEPILNGKPLSENVGYFRGNTSVFPLVPKTAIYQYPWVEIGVICSISNPNVLYPIERRKIADMNPCSGRSRCEVKFGEMPACQFEGIKLGAMCGRGDKPLEYRVILEGEPREIPIVHHDQTITIESEEYKVRLYPEFRN